MSEVETVVDCTYRDLIREAYIDPIRTVLIVDDEFPTLDKMIALQLNNHSKDIGSVVTTKENFEKVKGLLLFCRNEKRKWMVDVHDGSNVDEAVDTYLHQSDLLILDYQLDGDATGGEKAVKIIQHLSRSDHFNMVVVYTQHNIGDAFRHIVFGLLPEWKAIIDDSDQIIQPLLDKLEEQDENIFTQLKDCITEDTFLKFRLKSDPDPFIYKDDPDVKKYFDICESQSINNGGHKKKLFKRLLKEFEKKIKCQLSPSTLDKPDWKYGDECNWVKTNRIFITVVAKKESADSLPEKLLDSLTEWLPSPHRLIAAKMRTELESKGMNADDVSLTNHLIQASWLHDLLKSDPDSRPLKLSSLVSRHWEGLISGVREGVHHFSDKVLSNIENESDFYCSIKKFYDVDLAKKETHLDALLHLNTYNCSKAPEGWHLTTGHVIKLGTDYWICLTPACDLVPGQKQGGRYGALNPSIPFKAVKIIPFGKSGKEEALKNVNGNLCLFLNIDDAYEAFQFTDIKKPLATPTWDEMYAQNQGKFENDFKICIARLKWDPKSEVPMATWVHAEIVSQLRYEYALNLLQRLGGALMRIGLDFVPYIPE